jgi:hypothetical protein
MHADGAAVALGRRPGVERCPPLRRDLAASLLAGCIRPEIGRRGYVAAEPRQLVLTVVAAD